MRLFSSSRIMIRNDLQITWVKMCLAHNLWIGGMRRGRQKTRTYGSCVTNQNGSWRLHLMSRCTNTDHPAMGHHDDEHLHENTKTAVCSDLCTILDVGFVTWGWFVLMWLDPAIIHVSSRPGVTNQYQSCTSASIMDDTSCHTKYLTAGEFSRFSLIRNHRKKVLLSIFSHHNNLCLSLLHD